MTENESPQIFFMGTLSNERNRFGNFKRIKGIRIPLIGVSLVLMTCPWLPAQEVAPIGKTPEAQSRNKELLSGYDYAKYGSALTGFTGQDRQRIAQLHWQDAIRTRIGARGNYKAGMTQLPDQTLLAASCHDNNKPKASERGFEVLVYQSKDSGLTWEKISETLLFGKEPCLTVLLDGSLVLTTELGSFTPPGWPSASDSQRLSVSSSRDGGRTWETSVLLPGFGSPRNLIVEPDGSLLMLRPLATGWLPNGSTKMQLGRSKDGGKSWQFTEGHIEWNETKFAEISAMRLDDGRLLATLRYQFPGTEGEGFQGTVITESFDDGKHWSRPKRMLNRTEVHAYLTQLNDGRLLATYSNYHLPWGVYAVVSNDQGKSWDLDHPIQLALSAGYWVGWPVTLQLEDGSLITSYASTTHLKQTPDTTTTEVVRWRLP